MWSLEFGRGFSSFTSTTSSSSYFLPFFAAFPLPFPLAAAFGSSAYSSPKGDLLKLRSSYSSSVSSSPLLFFFIARYLYLEVLAFSFLPGFSYSQVSITFWYFTSFLLSLITHTLSVPWIVNYQHNPCVYSFSVLHSGHSSLLNSAMR